MAKIIYDYHKNNESCLDEKVDDIILDIVKNNTDYTEILNSSTDWSIHYHLNPARTNILSVCDIKLTDEILEIGSGCGAISSGILKQSEYLDSVEISSKRCIINYERNKQFSNFNIYVANFANFNTEKKYDKILLIGALKYANLFFPNESEPFICMLNKAKKLLKENGALYVTIENRYGMKYFSGAAEDYTGNYFESIEGYKNKTSITFSKNTLENIIFASGFEHVFFYYPLPDYKFAEEIYSDAYLPKHPFNNLGHSLDKDRYVMFNENKALTEASKDGNFCFFANSFLVECR